MRMACRLPTGVKIAFVNQSVSLPCTPPPPPPPPLSLSLSLPLSLSRFYSFIHHHHPFTPALCYQFRGSANESKQAGYCLNGYHQEVTGKRLMDLFRQLSPYPFRQYPVCCLSSSQTVSSLLLSIQTVSSLMFVIQTVSSVLFVICSNSIQFVVCYPVKQYPV